MKRLAASLAEMKSRVVSEDDLDGFSDERILKLILQFCDRRVDAVGCARRLLDKYHSIAEIIAEAPANLAKIDGVSTELALYLRFFHIFKLRMLKTRLQTRDCISSSAELFNYLSSRLRFDKTEQLILLMLDRKFRLIWDEALDQNATDMVAVAPRDIIKRCLDRGAARLVLAHNHPSGRPFPSPEDVRFTAQMNAACRSVEIRLEDHVIVAGDEIVSMRLLGLLDGYTRPATWNASAPGIGAA